MRKKWSIAITFIQVFKEEKKFNKFLTYSPSNHFSIISIIFQQSDLFSQFKPSITKISDASFPIRQKDAKENLKVIANSAFLWIVKIKNSQIENKKNKKNYSPIPLGTYFNEQAKRRLIKIDIFFHN
ncbi:hypothetical protein ABPG74_002224 [Tetrahymena malaccensis]